VDDDLLYQILVAFKSAYGKANESNTAPITSMLRCMCKVIPVIDRSRYIGVVFWLAVALLEGSHGSYYAEASSLLQVTLKTMQEQGLFKHSSVQNVLLEAREPLESVTSELDDMLKLSFETSFSFSLAAIIFKGLRHSTLKGSAEATLRILLQVTVASYDANVSIDVITDETLGYFVALLPVSTTSKKFHQLLKESKLDIVQSVDVAIPDDDDDVCTPCATAELLNIHDSTTALLVASFVTSIVSTAQGDDSEADILYGLLSSLSFLYPDTISMTYVKKFLIKLSDLLIY
jgi:neurofibromin 1